MRQDSTVQFSTAQYSTVQHSTVQQQAGAQVRHVAADTWHVAWALFNYVPGVDLGPISLSLPAAVVNCATDRARGTAIRGAEGGS